MSVSSLKTASPPTHIQTGETFEDPEPCFPFGCPQTVAPCLQQNQENLFRGTHIFLMYYTKKGMILASCKHHPTQRFSHTKTNPTQNEPQPLSLQLESIANYSEMQDSWVNRLSLFSCCNNSENLEFNFVLFSLSLIIKLQQFIDFHTFIQAPMLMQVLYFTRTNALSNFR